MVPVQDRRRSHRCRGEPAGAGRWRDLGLLPRPSPALDVLPAGPRPFSAAGVRARAVSWWAGEDLPMAVLRLELRSVVRHAVHQDSARDDDRQPDGRLRAVVPGQPPAPRAGRERDDASSGGWSGGGVPSRELPAGSRLARAPRAAHRLRRHSPQRSHGCRRRIIEERGRAAGSAPTRWPATSRRSCARRVLPDPRVTPFHHPRQRAASMAGVTPVEGAGASIHPAPAAVLRPSRGRAGGGSRAPSRRSP